jgi:hypothetical protein
MCRASNKYNKDVGIVSSVWRWFCYIESDLNKPDQKNAIWCGSEGEVFYWMGLLVYIFGGLGGGVG